MNRAAILVSLLLLAASLRAQSSRPTVLVNGGGALLVTLPDSILRDARVRKQLDSALTATFLLTAKLRGGSAGAARLEIRYDLWDEVYHVRRVDLARRVEQQRITAAQLEQWWRTPLRVAGGAADRAVVDLELAVLPFSAAEERDAREWLSKSGGVGGVDTRTSGVVDVLIGTTITARPIVSYRWTEVASKR